ncbi:MAG TPA: hypothetical protein VKE51_24435 [Vicinamibacterales bacterium]|nr:hypothetical protein [Vicinamibacterales bacterium]
MIERISFGKRVVAATALVIATAWPAAAASSAGCEGGGFTVVIGSVTISGNTATSVAASSVSGTITVRGRYVEFDVDPATFEVTNYALTGAPNPLDITGGVHTVVFASKSADLGAGNALTGPVAVSSKDEGLELSRAGAAVSMKIQANDCTSGGIFQMEPARADGGTIDITHRLAAGVFYFDNPNFRNPPQLPLCPSGGPFTPACTPVPITPRINFANDVSPKFVGRDSPQSATKLTQTGSVTTWRVSSGGRLGGVMGEDAVEVAPPAKPCTSHCQAQDQVRGRFPVLGFPFPVPAASRLP